MHNLVKVRVINVRKHSKHLRVDPLAAFKKVRREPIVLADPRGFTGPGWRERNDGLGGK